MQESSWRGYNLYTRWHLVTLVLFYIQLNWGISKNSNFAEVLFNSAPQQSILQIEITKHCNCQETVYRTVEPRPSAFSCLGFEPQRRPCLTLLCSENARLIIATITYEGGRITQVFNRNKETCFDLYYMMYLLQE